MSVTGKSGVGIPIILFHDSEGAIITIELKDGTTYRGFLEEAQDNMNCTMKDCIKKSPNSPEVRADLVYVRGAQIKFIVLPEILARAPYFNRIKVWREFRGTAIFGGGMMVGKGNAPATNMSLAAPAGGRGLIAGGRGQPRGAPQMGTYPPRGAPMGHSAPRQQYGMPPQQQQQQYGMPPYQQQQQQQQQQYGMPPQQQQYGMPPPTQQQYPPRGPPSGYNPYQGSR